MHFKSFRANVWFPCRKYLELHFRLARANRLANSRLSSQLDLSIPLKPSSNFSIFVRLYDYWSNKTNHLPGKAELALPARSTGIAALPKNNRE